MTMTPVFGSHTSASSLTRVTGSAVSWRSTIRRRGEGFSASVAMAVSMSPETKSVSCAFRDSSDWRMVPSASWSRVNTCTVGAAMRALA